VRTSNGFTLAGDLPDESTATSLRDALGTALPGARIVDDFKVVPGAQAPDFARLGGVFGAALEITDFGLKLEDGVITLTGTAPSQDVKAAAESAAAAAWPNVKIANDIQVKATQPPAPVPASPTPPR
jgi:peptidoglycan-binding protein ArfA